MNADTAPQIPTRVKAALAAGLGGLLVILLALAFYSAQVLRRARAADSDSSRVYLQRRESLTAVRTTVYATGSYLRDYLVDPEETRYRAHIASTRRAWTQAQAALGRYRDIENSTNALSHLEQVMDTLETLIERSLRLTGEERRRSGYTVFAEEIGPTRDALMSAIEDLAQRDDTALRSSISGTAIFLAAEELHLFEVIGISLALGLAVAIRAYRYLVKLEAEATTRYRQSVEANEQLERLSRRLLAVQEEERKSLARELHDEVGQSLGALLVDLGQAKSALAVDRVEAIVRLKGAAELGERALQSVRDISLLLRPSMLDDLGLLPALHWQAREVSRRSGMLVTVRSDRDDLDLEEELRTTVYRVVQEALQNAARHSGARTTEVALAVRDQHLQIRVQDNGVGFEPSRSRGLGLLGMQERIARLGGKLKITSEPGHGTALAIDLPLDVATEFQYQESRIP